MIIKKSVSLALAGCLAMVLLVSSASAADIKASAFVWTWLASYTNNSTGASLWGTYITTEGSEDTYSHLETFFYEAELKFTASGKTANGWKTYGELEFELGQAGKNDFELEEASANVDFGGFKLSMGILEDWGAYTGAAVYNWGIAELDTKFDDESPAMRFTYTGNKMFQADVKLQFAQASDKDATPDIDVSRNETRVQAKYNFGMGNVRLIYATETDAAIDSNVAGDYAYSAVNTDIIVVLKLGTISPFISVMNNNSKTTTEAGTESESKFSQNFLGFDYFLSQTTAITFNYMLQSIDSGGPKKLNATGIGLGANFAYSPVNFQVTYASFSNDMKEFTGGLVEDATQTTYTAGMFFKF